MGQNSIKKSLNSPLSINKIYTERKDSQFLFDMQKGYSFDIEKKIHIISLFSKVLKYIKIML